MTLQAPELLELLHSGDAAPDGGGILDNTLARFSATVILEEEPTEEEAGDDAPAARTFRALAVPYDVPIYRPSWMNGTNNIQFAKGSVTFADGAQIFFGHDWMSDGVPIGVITDVEETDAGPIITAAISRTVKGDEIWTLMQDGVLRKVSVGVEISKWEVDEEEALLTYLEAEAFETSVVPRPAFKEADVIGLNSKQQPVTTKERGIMPATAEALEASITSLNGTVENLSRQVETIAALGGQAGAISEPPFSSYGEFILAYAAADETALAFARDLREFMRVGTQHTFATDTGDLGGWLKDSWIGDTVRHPGNSRRLHNFFVSSALPATGMNVEYGVEVAPDPGPPADVAEQVTQNTNLRYGEMAFDSETAPVKTYGGYTTKSRQEVERSAMQVVEKWFTRMGHMWARRSEAALVAATAAAPAHVLAGTGTSDLTTADGWIRYIIQSALYFDDAFGLAPEGILVGYDVFEDLATMKINADPGAAYFLDRDSGRIDAPGLSGSVSGIQVIPVNSAGLVRVAHSEAIRTLESGNAPFQLTDDNIVNLSQSMSVYGYEAIAPESPELLVAPDVTA